MQRDKCKKWIKGTTAEGSILSQYWANEIEIDAYEREVDMKLDEIIETYDETPSKVVDLLLHKQDLLRQLSREKLRKIATMNIVDINLYRQFYIRP